MTETMLTETMLRTENLSRYYRTGSATVAALRRVNLAVARGEFVAIMGPSGSGKTTLLNLLGGLDTPTEGRVLVAGQPITGLDDAASAKLRRQTLGFVFQGYDLFPDLTARENVEFPLLVAGAPRAERRERAAELLEWVGLAGQAGHLPEELSGGQQQRVGIARCLANAPRVVLADEPTGNLDSATAGQIMDLLVTLMRREGMTLVMVTHDPDDAARADRVVYLRDGSLRSAREEKETVECGR